MTDSDKPPTPHKLERRIHELELLLHTRYGDMSAKIHGLSVEIRALSKHISELKVSVGDTGKFHVDALNKKILEMADEKKENVVWVRWAVGAFIAICTTIIGALAMHFLDKIK